MSSARPSISVPGLLVENGRRTIHIRWPPQFAGDWKEFFLYRQYMDGPYERNSVGRAFFRWREKSTGGEELCMKVSCTAAPMDHWLNLSPEHLRRNLVNLWYSFNYWSRPSVGDLQEVLAWAVEQMGGEIYYVEEDDEDEEAE